MESTGERNCIHISQETKSLLEANGKGHWVIPRKDPVFAKGKGSLKTYWCEVKADAWGSSHENSENISDTVSLRGSHTEVDNEGVGNPSAGLLEQARIEKQERLVDWNTDLLFLQLKEVVAERKAAKTTNDLPSRMRELEVEVLSRSDTCLGEVEEIIRLPHYVAKKNQSPGDTTVNKEIRDQLRAYVCALCGMYRENSFHNFEVRSLSILCNVVLWTQPMNIREDSWM